MPTQTQMANAQAAWPLAAAAAWPVGAIFLSVVSTNPATLLGFGTWSAIAAGRVLVGIDSGDTDFDTVRETGGAKTVTLTSAQMPAHTHTQNSHTHGFTDLRGATTGGATTTRAVTEAGDTSSTATGLLTAATTAVNQNAGGGEAHTNVQPYYVCYFWERTA